MQNDKHADQVAQVQPFVDRDLSTRFTGSSIEAIGRRGAHRVVQEQLEHHALHHALQRTRVFSVHFLDRDEPDRARQQDVQRRPARRLLHRVLVTLVMRAARFDQLLTPSI